MQRRVKSRGVKLSPTENMIVIKVADDAHGGAGRYRIVIDYDPGKTPHILITTGTLQITPREALESN